MDDVKKLKELLESNIDSSSFVNQLIIESQERRKHDEYVKTDEYWNWLDEILSINNYVHNSPSFSSPCTTEVDFRNADYLENLLNIVSEYADKNYIFPENGDSDIFYDLKYKDSYYRVGCLSGQGTFFYMEKIDSSTIYIDFSDVINDVDTKEKEDIDRKLDAFSDMIEDLLDSVPKNALISRFHHVVDNYSNDGKVKKYTRK